MADIRTTTKVEGPQARDVAVSDNPVIVGGRASDAVVTPVDADGDSIQLWVSRRGALMVGSMPHSVLDGAPYSLIHEGAQYTTTQTSTVLVAGGASEKLVVLDFQIQAFGTNAGDCILYFGTGAFARGTNRALFDGTWAPSATFPPGISRGGTWISGTNGDDLMVTTTGNLNVTFSVWYYVLT